MHTCESCHDPIQTPAPKPNAAYLCMDCYLRHEESRSNYAAAVAEEGDEEEAGEMYGIYLDQLRADREAARYADEDMRPTLCDPCNGTGILRTAEGKKRCDYCDGAGNLSWEHPDIEAVVAPIRRDLPLDTHFPF